LWVKILPVSAAGGGLNEKLDEKLDEKIGTARATILRLMRNNPVITVSRISSRLKMSRTAVDKNIQILKSRGYVKRIGPAKGGRWEVNGNRHKSRARP
jgi:ATP-dependent DNA helicase RecG